MSEASAVAKKAALLIAAIATDFAADPERTLRNLDCSDLAILLERARLCDAWRVDDGRPLHDVGIRATAHALLDAVMDSEPQHGDTEWAALRKLAVIHQFRAKG